LLDGPPAGRQDPRGNRPVGESKSHRVRAHGDRSDTQEGDGAEASAVREQQAGQSHVQTLATSSRARRATTAAAVIEPSVTMAPCLSIHRAISPGTTNPMASMGSSCTRLMRAAYANPSRKPTRR